MMNKVTTQTVYVRRGILHVCYEGRTYGVPRDVSAVTPTVEVDVNLSHTSDTMTVVQHLPMGNVIEIWLPVKF